MKELSGTEQLMYTTTRVECVHQNGMQSQATAFFCKLYVDNDHYFDVLVSNRHVFENIREITFHITVASDDGKPTKEYLNYHLTLDDSFNIVILHPNPKVDLAIILIRPVLINIYNKTGKKLFYKSIINAQIANLSDDKFDALEEILMVGYPVGIWDHINNRPIFRRGITATDPKVDYQGYPLFLIDCACIQGSSGSPIFSIRKGYLMDKYGKPLNMYGESIELMGIQSAMPELNQFAELAVVNVPTEQKKVANVRIPLNLGYIVKAEKILDFIPILRERLNALNKLMQNMSNMKKSNI